MNFTSKQRARLIFVETADLPEPERAAALERACGGDQALRAEVEALLRAEKGGSDFTDQPTADAAPKEIAPPARPQGDARRTLAGHEQPNQMIGRYKLLELIGEGGFGSVWAAEQREPVKRRVAVKVIKLGMDTRQVIARFEAERQALAMMDHPNIARVLDAGATEGGRPFFVMELVKGVPIIEYCDTERLDIAARLDLFMSVCHAIQHAHQKGIIHRDIKPSNVLVTLHDGKPVPKVIDFGIAKATNVELTDKTIFTQHRQLIGTPAYMSPEQAEMSGLDIDTRSDVYSLGVLLYEILTGTTPFATQDLLSKGFAEMMVIIREREPHKPSTRLSTLGDTAARTAQQRRVDVHKLGALLRGDLDWIVMKCLEKDRTRRYDTANGLAADVKRYLEDEPVTAGPPGAGYKLRKFVKRNRAQVIAGAAALAILVLGVVGTSAGMAWALREKSRAAAAQTLAERQAEQNARIVAAFESVFIEGFDASRVRGGEIAARDVLASAESIAASQLATDPVPRGAMLTAVAEAYRGMGDLANAERNFGAAVRAFEETPSAPAKRTYQARFWHAETALDAGRFEHAERRSEELRRFAREAFGSESPEYAGALNQLAVIMGQTNRPDQMAQLLQEATDIYRRAYGPTHEYVGRGLSNYAWSRTLAGDPKAVDVHKEAVAILESPTCIKVEGGNPGQYAASSRCAIAEALARQGRADEAMTWIEPAIKYYERTSPDGTIFYARALFRLAIVQDAQGAPELARRSAGAAITMGEATGGQHHPNAIIGRVIDGWLRVKSGEGKDGHDRTIEAMEDLIERFGETHGYVRMYAAYAAEACTLAGDTEHSQRYRAMAYQALLKAPVPQDEHR